MVRLAASLTCAPDEAFNYESMAVAFVANLSAIACMETPVPENLHPLFVRVVLRACVTALIA